MADPVFVPPAPTAAAPIFRPPSVAQQESETGRAFPGYREFVQLRNRGADLQKRIDALTVELAEARKNSTSTAQKVQLHQLNNALHRAGYELDTLIEDYKRRFNELVEDASVDWMRIKSNWIQNEDQVFTLQMLQAKCSFLKQGGDIFETPECFQACTDLEEELNKFANSHLSAGSLPDDALIHFGQLVTSLSRILVSAHEVAVEVPPWRPTLMKPPKGGLSVEFLKQTTEMIKEQWKQIPQDISSTRRLLPAGSWRKESDLRPEIYAFASLLYPNDPIHKIQVRDTLMYLDDDPDCRLRKIQVSELKQDEARCKEWSDAHTQHARLIEKARALAKEGNYKKAEKFVKQTTEIFADLDYEAYLKDAEPWKNEIQQIENRLGSHLDEARKILEQVLRRIWLAFGKFSSVEKLIEKTRKSIDEEARALRNFSGTDFYEDAQVPIETLRKKSDEIAALYENSLRTARFIAVGIMLLLAAVIGVTVAIVAYSIRARQAAVTITVTQQDPDDAPPTVTLGRLATNSFQANFAGLRAGTYPLEVDSPNFESYTNQVTISSSQRAQLPPITLVPIGGFLRLEAAPGGYSYVVKPVERDREVAAGTLTADDAANLRLRPGRYDVTFAQGNHQFHMPLEVTAREVKSYGPDFRFSHVRIDSEPPGAIVSLNGIDLGLTPLELTLPPVQHSIAVRMEGYETWYKPVKPEEGKPLDYDVTLRRTGPPVKPKPATNASIPQFTPQPDLPPQPTP